MCINSVLQVTAYTHKDSNNKWLLKLPNASLSGTSEHCHRI